MRSFSIIFLLSYLICAQVTSNLPQDITIELNSKSYRFESSDRAKIIDKLEAADINYTIVGMKFETSRSMSKILVPQTFDTTALIEQCILYFAFLGSEYNMRKETLLVYPFFTESDSPAPVVVNYSGDGRFKIKIRKWETIPMPEAPSTLEAEIFNMVLDESFSESQTIESIPEQAFKEVARANKIDQTVVEEIYQRVLLWQKSR